MIIDFWRKSSQKCDATKQTKQSQLLQSVSQCVVRFLKRCKSGCTIHYGVDFTQKYKLALRCSPRAEQQPPQSQQGSEAHGRARGRKVTSSAEWHPPRHPQWARRVGDSPSLVRSPFLQKCSQEAHGFELFQHSFDPWPWCSYIQWFFSKSSYWHLKKSAAFIVGSSFL